MTAKQKMMGELTAEDLVGQDRWLRGLVRGLVAESQVDDVVQDTWTAALGYGQVMDSPRAWLATVARRVAGRAQRSKRRRVDRERAVARPGTVEDAAGARELLELQGQVIAAVQELKEPYQTPILLRYVHGLSLAEVAERTGATESATRQRIKRGLDALREDVGVRYGEDWRELPGLALWLGIGRGTAKVSATGVLAIAALVLAAGAIAYQALAGSGAPLEGLAVPVRVADSAAERHFEAAAGERARGVGGSPAEEEAEAASVPPIELHGIALDPFGKALGGLALGSMDVRLHTIPKGGLPVLPSECVTAMDGTFVLWSPAKSLGAAGSAAYVPVAWEPFGDERSTWVLAPSRSLDLRILDAQRSPVSGASVRVEIGELPDYPGDVSQMQMMLWAEMVSDADGRVRLQDVPAGMGELSIRMRGYAPQRLELAEVGQGDLKVVLEEDPVAYSLRGWVRDPAGGPVSGARVGLGDLVTRSGLDGGFELSILESGNSILGDSLWAVMEPWRGVVEAGVGSRLCEAPGGELVVELQFEGERQSITGRILRSDGEPYSGLTLIPWDQRIVSGSHSLEELDARGRPRLGVGAGLRCWARTDEQGTFTLTDLQGREYVLLLVDMERGVSGLSGAVKAGASDWAWTVPDDFCIANQRGRLVDGSGNGLAGVSVRPSYWHYFSDRSTVRVSSASSAVTGPDGSFELPWVGGFEPELEVSGGSVLTESHAIDPRPGTELIVRVERRALLRLELTEGDGRVKQVEIHGSDGQPMTIVLQTGGVSTQRLSIPVENGRTPSLMVGESAAVLVLLDWQRRELGRIPLQLSTEGVQTIVW